MIALPTAFVEAMKYRMGEHYSAFINSYNEEPASGLRINTIKLDMDKLAVLMPELTERIPWTKDGYYTPPEARPGKNPFYHAGFYYIQEPSAMAPVNLMNLQEGDRVLDLCAAPGGKSVQIAAGIGKSGVLVTNDIHPDRTKVLARNMELYGVTRAIVLNERPERIAEALPQWFDKVLVDAPCSGEGMFRKDPDMVRAWEREPVLTYAAMQQEILDSAAQLVKPGGRLVYSTCTFSPEENEASIARFLTKHKDYRVVPIDLNHGFASGREDWARDCIHEHQWEASPSAIEAVAGTARIWPHLVRGEGHYVAVMERLGEPVQANHSQLPPTPIEPSAPFIGVKSKRDMKKQDSRMMKTKVRPKGLRSPDQDQIDAFSTFCEHNMSHVPTMPNVAIKDYLYSCPVSHEILTKLKVIRPGWFLGTCMNGRFEPAHAFAMGLRQGDAAREYHFSASDPDVIPYLRGDTLSYREDLGIEHASQAVKGYVLVMLEGSPLGFAKRLDHILKNEYPAAWRWT
ncbi:RsmB/NOP family class I SAM-dependent RNA methyltransferase [Paenibacillus marinisediminis]